MSTIKNIFELFTPEGCGGWLKYYIATILRDSGVRVGKDFFFNKWMIITGLFMSMAKVGWKCRVALKTCWLSVIKTNNFCRYKHNEEHDTFMEKL